MDFLTTTAKSSSETSMAAASPTTFLNIPIRNGRWDTLASDQYCEELAYKLLASLPRSRLAAIQRRIVPLLQFDVVGSLPAEISLLIFSHFTYETLLTSALVCRRWQTLSNDPFLWKNLCLARGWSWRQPLSRLHAFDSLPSDPWDNSDDEGMGDSDEEQEEGEEEEEEEEEDDQAGEDDQDSGSEVIDSVELAAAKAEITQMYSELDSGFASMSMGDSSTLALPNPRNRNTITFHSPPRRTRSRARHSAPSILSITPSLKPNYKLLYQTHIRLRNRVLSSSYRLSALQTRIPSPTPLPMPINANTDAHTNTIYCLQLYTYPSTGVQVLFTGSRDRTIREWNLRTGAVQRVISGVHESSVLSICAYNGWIASAGSDRRVAVWDLEKNRLVKIISDHTDSVLCVRFDDKRLVSCSKDRTVRTYSFPDLERQFVLSAHRAAVNAVSISQDLIVSGSGDRSMRLWDANTGKLLRTFEDHHTRGIASIDFKLPYAISGSSDKHLRLFDMTTLQGWCTSPDQYQNDPPAVAPIPFSSLSTDAGVCRVCGSTRPADAERSRAADASLRARCIHGDLVRSVALGEDFVVSGSYDFTIKVWDRNTGALVADLTGGHTGRIFCIGFDSTKIVSCGEDQRICIWDFSHGIDTSFIQL